MKISHEVPRCLLTVAPTDFNDYDYCLPHLLDEDEDYKAYFYEAKKNGRYIIMDNSLHELGEAYKWDRLHYWIKEIEPNEFIVPDVWMDYAQTHAQAKYWIQFNFPEDTIPVAVVQGKSEAEAVMCFNNLKTLGYKKIAISYGASWYNDEFPHANKDLGKALGRLKFISTLYKKKYIDRFDRIHLLGCAVPQEFGWYQGFDFIESIDTSNPIMAALDGTEYSDNGLLVKPKSNMNENFDMYFDELDYHLILKNTRKFRKINGLKPHNHKIPGKLNKSL